MTSATNDGARKLLNYTGRSSANERLKYFYGNLIGDEGRRTISPSAPASRSWRWAGDSHCGESKWTRYARTYCSWMTTIPTRNAAIRR